MATTGYKSILSVNDGGSNAQAAFAGASMVSLPFGEVKTHQFSVLGQSTKDLLRIPGMTDPGEVTFTLIFDKASYARLVALKGRKYYGTTTAVSVTWVVTTPDEDGTTATLTPQKLTFEGILTKAEVEMSNDGIAEIKGTIGVSGAISLTDGTNDS